MSISADRKVLVKRALRYLAVSAFLVVFNLVYGIFAHGIGSAYMRFAFLFPLVGGGGVTLLFFFLPPAGDAVRQSWRMGIATLVVGSLLHGVFDIYGSEVALVNVFFIAGGLLLVGALGTYLVQTIRARR